MERKITFKFMFLFGLMLNGILLSAQCDKILYGLTCESLPIQANQYDLDGYCTTLPDFANPSGPFPLCSYQGGGVSNNTIWFGFVAGCQNITLSVNPANCTFSGGSIGIQAGIYGGDCMNLQEIVCEGICIDGPIALESDEFIPGEVYYLIVDGCAMSVCDITIDVSGSDTTTLGNLDSIQGPQVICWNKLEEFKVPPVTGALNYLWTLDGKPIMGPDTDSSSIFLKIEELGNHQLCVDVTNGCSSMAGNPSPQCLDIDVNCDCSLKANAIANDILCYGGSTGSATADVCGGTPPFTFLWSNGENTAMIDSLKAGIYTLIVSDSLGFHDTVSIEIKQAEKLNPVLSSIPITNLSFDNGKANVSLMNGVEPFTYLWSNGATTASITNLTEGNYCVTVTDGNACTATDCTDVIALYKEIKERYTCIDATPICDIRELDGYITKLPDTVNPTGPNPLCKLSGGGVPNNSIWFGFVAGSQNITLSVNPANCTFSAGSIGIQAGIYGGDCMNLQEIVCEGKCIHGPISLESENFIPGQVYYLVVDGCNGSVCDITIDVLEADSLIMGNIDTIQGLTELCKGVETQYSIDSVYGAANYIWTLDGVPLPDSLVTGNKISISFDEYGVYQLCVDVFNYCNAINDLPEPKCIDIHVAGDGPLSVSGKSKDAVCFGSPTGNASVEACGGTPPYTYLWSNGVATSFVDSILAGIYTVIVTDSLGFTDTLDIEVKQSPAIVLVMQSLDAKPPLFNDGFAEVDVSGGTPPYSYLWNNSYPFPAIFPLNPGTYCVTVTDAMGCTATDCVEVKMGIATTDLLQSGWMLFPNPAADFIYLQQALPDNSPINWSVVDAGGNPVLNGEQQSSAGIIPLNVSELPSGNYYLLLKHQGRQHYAKFIIR